MTTASATPHRVLAVMDESRGQIALRSAAALADRHGAKLDVFSCVEPPPDVTVIARLAGSDPAHLIEDMCTRTRDQVEAHLARILPGRDVGVRLVVGKTFVEVIRHVIATDTDFVVKTAEPLTGLHGLLFASTDQHLLRKCPCPVWLQTDEASKVPRCVIAAVDVDIDDAAEPATLHSLNRRVIDVARMVAAPSGAQVIVLHAWDTLGEGMVWAFSAEGDPRASADAYVEGVRYARSTGMDRFLRELSQAAAPNAAPLVPRLVRGAPEAVIVDQIQDAGADVVVMGTVARTGLSGVFIGNTAENIINSVTCPVVAVKPDGFVSPLQR